MEDTRSAVELLFVFAGDAETADKKREDNTTDTDEEGTPVRRTDQNRETIVTPTELTEAVGTPQQGPERER